MLKNNFYSSFPQPLAPTILISVPMNLTPLGTSYEWNNKRLPFYDWLISLMACGVQQNARKV